MNVKNIMLTLGLLGFTFVAVSCQQEKTTTVTKQLYPPGHFAQQIKNLESANVTNDVNAAMVDADLAFLVCVGWGGTIPGVPKWNEQLYKKYGTRVIDGTGDRSMSEEQHAFKEAAVAYAAAYNKLLWSRTEGRE